MSCEVALQRFIAESRELLQIMEAALLCVEQGKMDADILSAVCSTANTIKGNAGLFGLAQVVGFIHVTESVLDKIRGVQVNIDRNLSLLLLECIDHIGVLIEDLENGISPSEPSQRRCNELMQRLIACVERDLAHVPPSPTFIHAQENALSAKVVDDEAEESRFSDYLDLLQACSRQEIRFEEMLKRFGALTQSELTRVLNKQVQGRTPGVVPVEAKTLCQLLSLLDELVTVGNGAKRLAQRAGDVELAATASSLSRLANEIRDSSLRLGVRSYT